jgi:hypothetical protein
MLGTSVIYWLCNGSTALVGLGLLWEDSRSHSSQKPLLDNTQHSPETGIHAPGRIQTRNSSQRVAIDPFIWTRGCWGRHIESTSTQLVQNVAQLRGNPWWSSHTTVRRLKATDVTEISQRTPWDQNFSSVNKFSTDSLWCSAISRCRVWC